MAHRYSRTDEGRAEIARRGRKLPRTSRNLLLLIDATREATSWIELIQGATAADIELLFAKGLIEPVRGEVAEPVPAQSLESAVARLSSEQLYGLMTSQAKERLGLIRGLMMILEVEKCSGPP